MINFIVWLVLGGIIGWLASLVMRTDAQQGIYEQLKASEALECPACGHHMTSERAAVMRHVEMIRRAMAGVRRRA